jgi:hypothetical protein
MSRTARTVAALGFALLTFGGCATVLTSTGPATTAIIGWERWLRVDWTSEAGPAGHDLSGYVYSTHGAPIGNVQLLAQAFDTNGAVVAGKLEWLPGVVPGLQRTYFRIPGLPAAASYRVTVWWFETIEGTGFL